MPDTRRLYVTMPDTSVWSVPVEVIARNRAERYAAEFAGDVERSLEEDTLELFKNDYEIEDWAANNMDWSDVHEVARHEPEEKGKAAVDWQEGWVNGYKEVRDA